ncbi:EDD domain protein, DegV family [Anaerobranca californiensis DSM 14826]|jgi:DegV family protein with EDD domain|uniref:EDD domain protein, DegV family n=1 Tax=Anaerobranca californiensis DSM 14826 TaxID=1120989 RepID=A0A1M6LG66_9FIRM|nr:DegV family protein [Anaerobranca californiensis]SHJ70172.1 EDD domain protein, DegV family [Anaerobranca californiensis DSM 14826]
MNVKIITDSACDLTREFLASLDVDVVPIMVYLEGEEYLDGLTLKPEDMLRQMREGKVFKTSQIPPNIFKEKFQQLAQIGNPCIYIAFSSGLSGTYNSALIAREEVLEEFPNFKLEIIDTKCASVGFGLVVYKAAMMAKEGKSYEEIIKNIKFNAQHMEHIFTVDDLEYLYRGGRVSKTAAFVGGILNVKPILHVEDGKLIPIDKVRGRQKAMKRMVEIVKERGVDLENQLIGINHGDDLEGANKLKNLLELELGCKDFLISCIGCAIGAHSGPGTLGVFFLNKITEN